MEVQSHNPLNINQTLLDLADELGIKSVATGDAHFAKGEDKVLEEAMLILSTNPKMNKDSEFEMSRNMPNMLDRFNYKIGRAHV